MQCCMRYKAACIHTQYASPMDACFESRHPGYKYLAIKLLATKVGTIELSFKFSEMIDDHDHISGEILFLMQVYPRNGDTPFRTPVPWKSPLNLTLDIFHLHGFNFRPRMLFYGNTVFNQACHRLIPCIRPYRENIAFRRTVEQSDGYNRNPAAHVFDCQTSPSCLYYTPQQEPLLHRNAIHCTSVCLSLQSTGRRMYEGSNSAATSVQAPSPRAPSVHRERRNVFESIRYLNNAQLTRTCPLPRHASAELVELLRPIYTVKMIMYYDLV
eukprot:IDg17896t1